MKIILSQFSEKIILTPIISLFQYFFGLIGGLKRNNKNLTYSRTIMLTLIKIRGNKNTIFGNYLIEKYNINGLLKMVLVIPVLNKSRSAEKPLGDIGKLAGAIADEIKRLKKLLKNGQSRDFFLQELVFQLIALLLALLVILIYLYGMYKYYSFFIKPLYRLLVKILTVLRNIFVKVVQLIKKLQQKLKESQSSKKK